jgi:hypothetical protein
MSAPLTTAGAYGSRPIKRYRRGGAEMEAIREGLYEIVADGAPMTVRQVFYQATVAGLVEKSEAQYKGTVARLLLEMRRDGTIPYRWIADNTRWMRKPSTYNGLADFIARHQRAYRRDLWAEADIYVEVWVEKEALAGVLMEVTEEFDVPLMVTKGFASESYLYAAADVITDHLVSGKDQVAIYYFGDFDPSGMKIGESVEEGLRRLCSEIARGFKDDMLVFERAAVTERQIAWYGLPTRPTKVKGNRHANGWGRPSVELDAFRSSDLRGLVRECIEQHLDEDDLEHLRRVEAEERQQLKIFGQRIAEEGAG